MMLQAALDCFHPVDSGTESGHLYLKAEPAKSGWICCLREIILFRWEGTVQPWLYWKDNTVFLTKTGTLIPATTQERFCWFFFSLLKFPHPEFTVGALIFILPPLQKSQTQLLLPCQYHLSVQPQPGVTVVKECAARLCLAKPELGLFWPLQTFKNGDILPPTPLS